MQSFPFFGGNFCSFGNTFDERLIGGKIALDYVMSREECQVEDPEFDSWCDRVIIALENAKLSV